MVIRSDPQLLLVAGAPAVWSPAPRVSIGLAVPRDFAVSRRRGRRRRHSRSHSFHGLLRRRLLGGGRGGGLGTNGNPLLLRPARQLPLRVPVRALALGATSGRLPSGPHEPNVVAPLARELVHLDLPARHYAPPVYTPKVHSQLCTKGVCTKGVYTKGAVWSRAMRG